MSSTSIPALAHQPARGLSRRQPTLDVEAAGAERAGQPEAEALAAARDLAMVEQPDLAARARHVSAVIAGQREQHRGRGVGDREADE